MSSDRALYERDPEAWNAHLAEGNAKQARKRVSADVILRDALGRILLVDPKYKPDWDLPGGMAEANEPPADAVRRELREELGFDLQNRIQVKAADVEQLLQWCVAEARCVNARTRVHARQALLAAQQLLQATGYSEKDGPWLPIGVGVHTGVAFVGTVKGAENSVDDVTALGDSVNVAARLASRAGSGEALISDTAYASGGLNLGELEQRQLRLKGRNEPIMARVLRVAAR